MVRTDPLSKETILESMNTMNIEICVKTFSQFFCRLHGFHRAIVSGRGSNWVGDFWRRLCDRVSIEQKL